MIKAIIRFFKRLFGIKVIEKVVYKPVVGIQGWSEYEVDVLYELNKYREELGLKPFKPERLGHEEAKKRVDFLDSEYEITGKFSHGGVGIAFEALGQAGFGDRSEILGLNYSLPSTVVQGWIKSKSHDKVLKSNSTYCGVGFKQNKEAKEFWCCLFYN